MAKVKEKKSKKHLTKKEKNQAKAVIFFINHLVVTWMSSLMR